MKTLFKILFIGTVLMVLAAMFGGFALLHHGGPDMHIVLDDGEFFLGPIICPDNRELIRLRAFPFSRLA